MPDDAPADAPTPSGGTPVPNPLPDSLPLPATSAQVAQFVAFRAAACVGADYANLALLTDSGASLRLYDDIVSGREVAPRHTDVAIDAPYPITTAIRGGARRCSSVTRPATGPSSPGLRRRPPRPGWRRWRHSPSTGLTAPRSGALAFGWKDATAFHPKTEAALRAVAVLCVETVERAERYDADHELVLAMQRRLLGELPTMAGLDTHARYMPATAALAVGGDWYEGLVLADGRMALVVGDVAGHGVAAAADMALVPRDGECAPALRGGAVRRVRRAVRSGAAPAQRPADGHGRARRGRLGALDGHLRHGGPPPTAAASSRRRGRAARLGELAPHRGSRRHPSHLGHRTVPPGSRAR